MKDRNAPEQAGLPFATLIGGPLEEASKAQLTLTDTPMDFLRECAAPPAGHEEDSSPSAPAPKQTR